MASWRVDDAVGPHRRQSTEVHKARYPPPNSHSRAKTYDKVLRDHLGRSDTQRVGSSSTYVNQSASPEASFAGSVLRTSIMMRRDHAYVRAVLPNLDTCNTIILLTVS